MDLVIRNAKIIESENKTYKVNIYVDKGKIKAIESVQNPLHDAKRQYDAKDNVIFPGIIDSHVHFDEPGFTHREDFTTGTKSAAAGGVTTVIDMPCTSIPPVTTADNFDNKLNIIQKKAYIDFALWGGITPQQITKGTFEKDLEDLKQKGVVGVKFYTVSGMKLYPRMPLHCMDKAFRKLAKLNLVCAVHAEDYELVNHYSKLYEDDGKIDPYSWCDGRTYEAEPAAIWQVVAISKKAKNKLHIVHLSTSEGLDIVRRAKREGLDITCETCPQYLIFTRDDFNKIGPILKIAPPLRYKEDRKQLWNGLKDGTIDYITTDHAAGVWPEEKDKTNIWEAYAGIPGIQTSLSSMITFGYHKNKLSLYDIQNLMSTNPAKRYGLYPRKGVIQKGQDADFAVVDVEKEFIIEPKKLYSKGKYSPFAQKKLKGKVIATFLRGNLIYEEDKGVINSKRCGKFIKSKL